MDKHEMAMRTYEELQKRKKRKELQHRLDIEAVGWNGYTKYMAKRHKKYYERKHTV